MRLVLINIAVFLLLKLIWLISPSAITVEEIIGALALPASFGEAVKAPWSIVTYMFIHVDFWHLLVNCLWLAWFGALLKEIAGRRILALNFIAGGIAGGLCYLSLSAITDGESGAYLLGASAAVFAVITATLISAPRKRVTLAFIGSFSLRSIAAVGMVLFFLASIEMDSSQTAAHLGGIIVGTASSMAWRTKSRRRMEAMKSRARNRLEHLSLIEKVNRNGYSSLSRKEQLRLFNLSASEHSATRNPRLKP